MAKNQFGNMGNIMKQAQKMQQNMMKAQEEIEQQTVQGTAGGEAVCVTVNGKKQVLDITLKPEIVDADDIEMLQDLIVAAVNSAMEKVDALVQEITGKYTGGMNIPGMF